MTEYERRCRKAAYELHLMGGSRVIDLNRIQQILDPDRVFESDWEPSAKPQGVE